jgi:hypothetical protein
VDTAYVTVNTQPEVTIERLTNVTTICVEGNGSAVSVTYRVSSGAANSSLEVVADAPSEAGCSVTGPTGATDLDHQALWVLLLGMQSQPMHETLSLTDSTGCLHSLSDMHPQHHPAPELSAIAHCPDFLLLLLLRAHLNLLPALLKTACVSLWFLKGRCLQAPKSQ